jgi:hypothetical protein
MYHDPVGAVGFSMERLGIVQRADVPGGFTSAYGEHAFSWLMSVVIVEIFQDLPVPLKGMEILWKLAGKYYDAINDFGGEKHAPTSISHTPGVFEKRG